MLNRKRDIENVCMLTKNTEINVIKKNNFLPERKNEIPDKMEINIINI
jgi:hypothetical protein